MSEEIEESLSFTMREGRESIMVGRQTLVDGSRAYAIEKKVLTAEGEWVQVGLVIFGERGAGFITDSLIDSMGTDDPSGMPLEAPLGGRHGAEGALSGLDTLRRDSLRSGPAFASQGDTRLTQDEEDALFVRWTLDNFLSWLFDEFSGDRGTASRGELLHAYLSSRGGAGGGESVT